MFRTSRYSLFILAALLAFTTYAGFVDCPTTPAFVNCLGCWQFSSSYPIECACPNTQFAIVDRCFTPYYPCNSSFISLIYLPNSTEFNIWNSTIQPFWEQKFTQAKTNTSPPNPLPNILNNYNFAGMNLTLMRGWTEAYYLYLIFQNETSSWTVQKRSEVLYQAVQLAQDMLGNKTFDKWQKMGNMTNNRLNKNMTYEQFFQFIRLRAKVLAPCHTCKPMYGPIRVGDLVKCSKCSPQCKSCTANTSKCNTCFDGNYLSGLFTCEDCHVGDCQDCTENQCLTCYGYKTIDGGQCADCNGEIGCSLCQVQEPDICKQCNWLQYSNYPNSQGKCFKCTQDSCQDCNFTNPSQCTLCASSYYNDSSSICQPCPQNCLVCKNNKICNQCFYGFGLVRGVCRPCNIPGCFNCDQDLNSCSSCITPYFEFNTTDWTCILTKTTTRVGSFIYQTAKCKPGCDYCYDNNTDHCYSCHERYYMENRYCKKCMAGCLQCSTAVNCLLCVSGYALVGWNCVRCPDNCRKCSSSNTSQCLDCRHGYYNDNQVCKPSPKPQCFIFDYAENDKCLVCMPGYALTSEKKCIQCQVSCQYSCNPLNISQCKRNRFQLLGQYVYMHVFNIQGCDLYVNGNCLAPQQGWQLTYDKGNKIVVKWDCLYPCATCNISTCYSCQPGYTFLNGNCNFDFSCNPNCTNCLPGTQRNYTTNACVACPATNCGACLNGVCLQCLEGYYLQGQTCLRCPDKCQRCYDANNCNTCASGYLWPLQMFEYAYDCVKCSENCKTCKFQPSLCTQCYPGMRLANFRCIKQYQAAFRYVLKYNYTEFLSGMKSEVLISELINRTNVNYSDIFIISIKNGSTIVDGIISAFNASAATTIYQSLKSYTLKSFIVQGSSLSFVNQTVVVKCFSSGSADCPAGTEQSISGGLIAGIVIGVIALIILVVVLVMCWRKRQRRTGKSSDIQIQSNSAASTNKAIDYQNVPPTSASDLQKKI